MLPARSWGMTPKELQDRTRRFAVEVIRFSRELPPTLDGRRRGGQLLDAGTSVAANYRAACRARSRAEFAAKIGVVLEEADESLFWLELMVDADTATTTRTTWLRKEADELVAIFVSSRRTVTATR